MAGRAYMVFDANSNQPDGGDPGAQILANEVFKHFKLNVLMNNSVEELQVNDPESFNHPSNNLYVGVWADFKQILPTPSFGKGRKLNSSIRSFFRKRTNSFRML